MTPEEKQKLCAQVNDLIARHQLPLPDALGILEIVKYKMLRDAYERRVPPTNPSSPTAK